MRNIWKSCCTGKSMGIISALAVLILLGASDSHAEGVNRSGGGGGGWKYTGEYFDSVFRGFPKDEGVVYQHFPRHFLFHGEVLVPITVMQSTKKGNLVQIEGFSRMVWVETQRRYEDDEPLDQGYYIRRGSFEYITALGVEQRVARYVEVSDNKMLREIENAKQELEAKEKAEEEVREAKRQAEEEAREAKRKAEEEAYEAKRQAEEAVKKKAREEAAEQGAYELDIPIKSLCGFKLGVPPSQVRPLLQNDDGTPIQDFVEKVLEGWWCSDGGCKVTYRLAKPFRLFTHATVSFYDRGVGMHLDCVRLKADISNVSNESWTKEMMTVVGLIEEKFGIKFEQSPFDERYIWGRSSDCRIEILVDGYNHSLELEFEAYLPIFKLDNAAKQARKEVGKKTIDLDVTAGADEL